MQQACMNSCTHANTHTYTLTRAHIRQKRLFKDVSEWGRGGGILDVSGGCLQYRGRPPRRSPGRHFNRLYCLPGNGVSAEMVSRGMFSRFKLSPGGCSNDFGYNESTSNYFIMTPPAHIYESNISQILVVKYWVTVLGRSWIRK